MPDMGGVCTAGARGWGSGEVTLHLVVECEGPLTSLVHCDWVALRNGPGS